jgi:hypothetical protein
MEVYELYCSACDRQVRVAYPAPPEEATSGSEVDANGVCIDYCSNACTGSMCSLFDLPPEEMRSRLREQRRAKQSEDRRVQAGTPWA